ncbi:flippase activity-associated protein Agl23 [Bacteroidota bacterium]
MKLSSTYLYLLMIILIIGGTFRLTSLDLRPMHTDEAVHAIKFGALLEKWEYIYDKNEYHGPVLNYLTLIPAYIQGEHNLVDIDEVTLRLVPAIIGLFLLLIPLWLFKQKDWKVALPAVLLLAVSPAMVFYSRYYIMEILLVFFTYGFIASCYGYLKTLKMQWAFLAGIFLGLMHATKETWIISVVAMIVAGLILFYSNMKGNKSGNNVRLIKKKHIILSLIIAVFVSITFYSSFYTNPQGVIDSFTTYTIYYFRAGQSHVHDHPWGYYFNLLTWNTGPGNIIWSELFIVLLAISGFIGLLRRKAHEEKFYRLLLFIGLYSLILTLIYSFLPYKTPWNLLQFYCGYIILAGYGFLIIWRIIADLKWKIVIIIIISGGFLHLIWQSWAGSFEYYAEPENPYVYGHTSNDIKLVHEFVDKVASIHPEGQNMFIEIVFPGSDYWPLPWYLREYPNIGWWNHVDFNVPAAPLVIASPEVEEDLLRKWFETPAPGYKTLYMPLFNEYITLRPGVELRGYLSKETWDKLQVHQ